MSDEPRPHPSHLGRPSSQERLHLHPCVQAILSNESRFESFSFQVARRAVKKNDDSND